jgi:outer membrane protein assembly factor BamA
MDTEKDDFVYALGKYWEYDAPTFKLTLYDRMLELGLGRSKQKGSFEKFVAPDDDDLTKQGVTVTEFDPPLEVNLGDRLEFMARIDYTDDYRDPRKGIRNILYLDRQTASSSSEPSFDVITNDLQIYIPFLEKSTLVFNLTFSDANIRQEGETDLEVLKQQSNYYLCDYSPTPESCRETTLGNAINTQNINKHGTSLFLGGPDRLRSYPQQRFQGAHTLYFATEFRWNFSASEGDKIDVFFMQDLVDEMQVAFFFEQGSVSETKTELGNTVKYSFGSGFRVLSGSGNLYRADFATGDEGPVVTVIIQYPWTYRI